MGRSKYMSLVDERSPAELFGTVEEDRLKDVDRKGNPDESFENLTNKILNNNVILKTGMPKRCILFKRKD